MDDKAVVYIVDDDEAVREGIADLVQGMGLASRSFTSAEEFRKAQNLSGPCCLLLDMRMPGMSGMELLSKLAAEGTPIPTIIVSGHGDVPTAVEAMNTGAVDFIEKPVREQELWTRIRRALEKWADLEKIRAQRTDLQEKLSLLNSRECEVLRFLVTGETDKQIANRLDVGRRAVAFHRTRILEKMTAANVIELATRLTRFNISP